MAEIQALGDVLDGDRLHGNIIQESVAFRARRTSNRAKARRSHRQAPWQAQNVARLSGAIRGVYLDRSMVIDECHPPVSDRAIMASSFCSAS